MDYGIVSFDVKRVVIITRSILLIKQTKDVVNNFIYHMLNMNQDKYHVGVDEFIKKFVTYHTYAAWSRLIKRVNTKAGLQSLVEEYEGTAFIFDEPQSMRIYTKVPLDEQVVRIGETETDQEFSEDETISTITRSATLMNNLNIRRVYLSSGTMITSDHTNVEMIASLLGVKPPDLFDDMISYVVFRLSTPRIYYDTNAILRYGPLEFLGRGSIG